MKALIVRELRSHLYSARGIAFLSVFLLAIGGYTIYYNLLLEAASTAYTVIELYIAVTLLLPIVTFKALLAEREEGRYKFLRSLPIEGASIVAAKLVAVLCLAALPFLLLIVLPLVLGAFGEISLSMSLFSIAYLFGYFAAYASLGILMSAIFRSSALACTFTYVAGAVMFCVETFVLGHLYALTAGIFDISVVIYHLSIVAVSLITSIFLFGREGFARRVEDEE